MVSGRAGEVWRWFSSRVFLPVIETVVLMPGQSVFYSGIWPQVNNAGQRVLPGIYRVTGWNTFMGAEVFPALSIFIRILGLLS